MSSLIKTVAASKFAFRNNVVLVNAVRNHWNKDFKPGPYPTTPEERAKAAAKYNLLPEEYDCYPDDGSGKGDYPNIPMISLDAKDPFYPYDYPELKRNYKEVIHPELELIRNDRCDVTTRPRFSFTVQAAQFLGVMGLSIAIYLWCESFKMAPLLTAPHLPAPGKKHYSFEPAD